MAKLEGVKTLDMVNGEITKVAYGGAEYERVEGEAKAGDIGLRTDRPTSYATVGAFYQFVYDLGGLSFIDDVGDKPYVAGNHFAIFRKVDAGTNPSVEERVAKAEGEIESLKSDVAALKGDAEPKSDRLKVGYYAKVVKRIRDHSAEIGEIVLVKIADKSVMPYRCDKLNGERVGWFYADELVRATDEEVAEAKDEAARAKFKEGDKVLLKSGGGEFPLNGYENGKVYEVENVEYQHPQGKHIRIIGGDFLHGFATPDQLEILSEEEATERKKWAEIGREVGEYKVGDVVAYDDLEWFGNSGIGEVVGFDVGTPRVRSVNRRGDKVSMYLDPGKLRLITPVEARFDR
ncbi:hypothetical protein [Bacillus subtilis]|uniref:hypothetical protein n=1 Tax=Bacillus subtilis TaxID=1423 RepID=UPI001B913631|nr:hypothetical protein [Bacillus subtilis]CAF1803211.1 hypothetical protein NRS6141_00798 [Bacillus subtilis]CAF1876817.1 hypothetical protein NRS6204_00314 [Bacillus subtilis]CAF1878841.1 hypothetical protein NRS6205_00314 [Bacillus subtilis]